MPYRPRSTDVWFNAPGIVAAYQPVACPAGALAARINVANEQKTPGMYAAAPGTAPTHDPRYGWTFAAASSQYLTTGVTATSNAWSMFVAFSDGATTGDRCLCGGYTASGATNFSLWQITGSKSYYSNFELLASANYITSGVLAMAGKSAYKNGAPDGTIGAGNVTSAPINIGRAAGLNSYYFDGNIQAFAVCAATLAPSQMAQYSRQMAYCHVNPDWNAWGRRRRYYYAPSAAAGVRWPGVGRGGPVGGSIGIQGQQQ